MPVRQLVATASLINITVVEEPMKYLSRLFATALVSLLAMGGVAQAQDMKFFRIGTGSGFSSGTDSTLYHLLNKSQDHLPTRKM